MLKNTPKHLIFVLGERIFIYMLNHRLIQDLSSCYFRILRESRVPLTRFEICRLIEKSPAPCFYITLSYAQRIISDLENGKPRARHYHMREAHAELYRRWQQLDDKSPESLETLLNSPAPRFYLSAHRINRLLYKIYDKRKPTQAILD